MNRRIIAVALVLLLVGAILLREQSVIAQGGGGNYAGPANSTTTGPTYGTGNNPAGPVRLAPGDSVFLFVGAQPTPPQASIEVFIPQSTVGGTAPGVSFEALFSGAPGAFSLQLQEADTDADGFFITPTQAAYTVTTVNSNQVARSDLSPTGGKFLRVLLASRTNAVNLTVKLSRIN